MKANLAYQTNFNFSYYYHHNKNVLIGGACHTTFMRVQCHSIYTTIAAVVVSAAKPVLVKKYAFSFS